MHPSPRTVTILSSWSPSLCILLLAHFFHMQLVQVEAELKNVNMHQTDSFHLYFTSITAFNVCLCTKSTVFNSSFSSK